ncbi:MAG TPA: DNA-directed RNA polymerase subunit omega [Paenibacillus sp.]|nr:DNA-directed RNA polymerase subunit omega [Paenibacillus sp.]
MLYPSIDKLVDKAGSKYLLVVAASKRARALREGAKSDLRNPRSHKQVGVALEEIHNEYITYEKTSKETALDDSKQQP